MSLPESSFYVTGGTLRHDAPSYVERAADRDLYEGLSGGEFCYILTSRQMGKSSLMARTAARLRDEGVAVVILDLTAIGQNLSPEQWYDGLRDLLGQQLDLEDALDDFWSDQAHLGPLQRWMKALREVVLARRPGPIVIFLEEIDTVQSLPFSTDEFFAGVRQCYNQRTQDPEFGRLTFCLLGVASPTDLIQDTRLTPFNIGRRIELTDFTGAEAVPLAAGWVEPQRTQRAPREGRDREAQVLLQRVLYWTGGHPYLTQRLCRAIFESRPVSSPSAPSPTSVASVTSVATRIPSSFVDRLCQELFLSKSAQETDDNLLFVRERLLRSGQDLAAVLDLYRQTRRSSVVVADDTDPLIDLLRLSGIVRTVDGRLRVRNRIYERVFDRDWVTTHMPDAELRRQRAAYRRGLVRAATVAAAVVVVVVALAITALQQAWRANRTARAEARQRQIAEARRAEARRNLYAAEMNLAQQSEEAGDVAQARRLLESHRPEPGEEDLRGFEWRYLWRLCQGDALATLRGHLDQIITVAFSPDGKTLASSSSDKSVKLWDVASKREIASLTGHTSGVTNVSFLPDGKTLVTSSFDRTVKLWDLVTRRAVATLRQHSAGMPSLAASPDGRLLAVGDGGKPVTLWDVPTRQKFATLPSAVGWTHAVAFSPDGRSLAVGTEEGEVELWDLASRRVSSVLRGHTALIDCLAFSSDGQTLASGSEDSTIRLWDVASRRAAATFRGHTNWIGAVAFSPDGKILASVGGDATVRLWDVATRRVQRVFKGHESGVAGVAFSPDGRLLASGSYDGTVRLWGPAAEETTVLVRQKAAVEYLALSSDGTTLATANGDRTVAVWDRATGRRRAILRGHRGFVYRVQFSPDGRLLASLGEDGTVRLSDLPSGRAVAVLRGYTGGSWGMAFSRDSRTLAFYSRAAIKLWDLATQRVAAVLKVDGGVNPGLAISPDGRMLAALSGDDRIQLWDFLTRRPMGTLEGLSSAPLIFSLDGRTLVTNGPEMMKLWDLGTKRVRATLAPLDPMLSEFALSPDGHTLASAASMAVRLWNLRTRRKVATLTGHDASVRAVVFTPDGNGLLSGSTDGTVRLWKAAPLSETDLPRFAARGGERTVELQWAPLLYATAYRVYRGPLGAAPAQLAPLTSGPSAETSFTDQSPELTNGRPLTYGVAAVYRDRMGRLAEGPRVTRPATPIAAPPGWMGSSINEGARPGSARFDAQSGKIILRGSARDMWGQKDSCYFLNRPVSGDFQITATLLTRPRAIHEFAQTALMVRTALESGSGHASLLTDRAHGLEVMWRPRANDPTDVRLLIPDKTLKLPITLRLTRRGNTLIPTYAHAPDGHFQAAGDPLTFESALPSTLYVGLAITAFDVSKVAEATYSGLRLEQP